jgi:PAS domain S-box-containing protein
MSRHAEADPQGSRSEVDALCAALGAIVWDADPVSGAIQSVSDNADALLGLPRADWLRAAFWDEHLHPDDRASALVARRDALARRQDYALDYRMVARDGGIVWIREAGRFTPVAGQVRLRGLMLDVSRERRAERALRRLSQELDEAQRLARVGTFAHDLASRTLSLSARSRDLLEAVGADALSFDSLAARIHPDDAAAVRLALDEAAMTSRDLVEVEGRVRADDGRQVHLKAVAHVIRNDAGAAVRVFGTVQDVTEQRVAESASRAHLRFLETLDAVNVAIQATTDPDTLLGAVLDIVLAHFCADRAFLAVRRADPMTWVLVDERTRPDCPGAGPGHEICDLDPVFTESLASGRALQYGLDNARGLSMAMLRQYDVVAAYGAALTPAGHGPYVLGLHYCHLHPVWAHDEERLLQEIGRRLTDALTVARAHRALQHSEDRLREAQRLTRLGYWERDFVRGTLEASAETLDILGGAPDEPLSVDLAEGERRWRSCVHPDDLPQVRQAAERALAGMQPYDIEYRVVRPPTGEVRHVRSTGEMTRDGDGRPVRWFGTLQDVTDRRKAEQAALESHALMRAIVEGTTDAIYVKDLQGTYLMVNRAFADLRDATIDEIVGTRDIVDGQAGLGADEVAVLTSGEPRAFEQTVDVRGATRTLHAVTFPYHDASGAPIGLIGVWRDTTERKHLELELRQAQKMEAIGRLAGGVAHNFNNLLTVILGYAEVIGLGMPAGDPNHEAIEQVVKGAERAAAMTRQLLTFSRAQSVTPRVVQVGAALHELHTLLRPLIPEDIDVTMHLDDELGAALMDPGQFEQAMTNLVVNASDAMPDGGRLRIEAINTRIEPDDDSAALVADGDYVEVRVWDSGHGMDEATRARIFEPFFTTKPTGKGTGLGLSMVYGFVTQLGGHIDVTTTPGAGTLFRLLLPRSADAPVVAPAHATASPATGSETILLVEDEEAVRRVARLVLSSRGYRVLEARDGVHALAVLKEHGGEVDLLLTDLVMPRMNGQQLAERVASDHPDVRVLLMSGYPDRVVPAGVATDPRFEFLSKPFQPSTLARRVRECLDRTPPGEL